MSTFKNTKFFKWIDNYWYHYKWRTLIIAFFALIVIIASVQFFTKADVDIYILYTGPHVFAVDEIHEVESAFEQVMSGDRNRDGKKTASLQDITLLTEDQILEARREADEMGINLTINTVEMRNMQRQFNTQIFAGEAVICLLDPYWYEQVRDSGGFMTLASVLGEKPPQALDDYGICLFDTDFGRYFTAFSKFPDDTVLCIRVMSTTSIFKGVSKEEERHAFHVQSFRDALSFRLPEGWTPESAANPSQN